MSSYLVSPPLSPRMARHLLASRHQEELEKELAISKDLLDLSACTGRFGRAQVDHALENARLRLDNAIDRAVSPCVSPRFDHAGYAFSRRMPVDRIHHDTMMKKYLAIRELLQANYTVNDLKQAGYTTRQIIDACHPDLEINAMLEKEYKSLRELIDSGYSYGELKRAGYSAWQLIEAGFGCSRLPVFLDDFVEDGYVDLQLRDAVRTTRRMLLAGYTFTQVRQAATTLARLLEAGCTVRDLQVAADTSWCFPPESSLALLRAMTRSELEDFGGIWRMLRPHYTDVELDFWANTLLLCRC